MPRPEPEVPEELVEHELEALRSSVAELVPVEGRGAQEGDALVIDVDGEDEGEAQRDFVVELGAGRLAARARGRLGGMSAGETKAIEYELRRRARAPSR